MASEDSMNNLQRLMNMSKDPSEKYLDEVDSVSELETTPINSFPSIPTFYKEWMNLVKDKGYFQR